MSKADVSKADVSKAGVSKVGGTSALAGSIAKIRAVVEPVLASHRVELVELAWVTEHGQRTLRITIERSGVGPTLEDQLLVGFGVSLEDCAVVSRSVSEALDLADIIEHAYTLEVSSPGLDRPLRHLADFRRFMGQLVKVKLAEPAPDGQRVLRGRLVSVDGTGEDPDTLVTVEVDRKPVRVRYGIVETANLVYELPTQGKPSEGKPSEARLNGGRPGEAEPMAAPPAKAWRAFGPQSNARPQSNSRSQSNSRTKGSSRPKNGRPQKKGGGGGKGR